MEIATIDNCALAEFKDSITSVIFFCGCDMNCQYCQNPHLIKGKDCNDLEWQDIVNKVEWDVVDWLSLTGGEPLHSISASGEGDELVSMLSYAREEGVRINIDTNGYLGTVQKQDLLRKVSGLIDCLSVDLKYIDPYWVRRLKVMLDNAKVFKKARFRMVVYNGRYYKDPGGVQKLADAGITDIKILPNSCGGRGNAFGKTNERVISDITKYFNDRGVRLHK
jgi:pyruvate-formate lyase-activating enzyme